MRADWRKNLDYEAKPGHPGISAQICAKVAPRPGLEPGTCGLPGAAATSGPAPSLTIILPGAIAQPRAERRLEPETSTQVLDIQGVKVETRG